MIDLVYSPLDENKRASRGHAFRAIPSADQKGCLWVSMRDIETLNGYGLGIEIPKKAKRFLRLGAMAKLVWAGRLEIAQWCCWDEIPADDPRIPPAYSRAGFTLRVNGNPVI